MRKDFVVIQDPQQYLTIAEAAAILRVSPLSLQNNISRAPQKCPPYTRVGRLVRINIALLHQWMLDGTVYIPPNPAISNSINKKCSVGRPRKKSSMNESAVHK
jgi:hypothetical protein